jgi:two-component system sensor histidine kinase TctE
MSAEQRQRIEAFRQHGRSEREQQGLGLGLAIVRSAVELAGGELSLETGPGNRGLKATLDLPCS